jgi:hypothetical protein
MSGSQDVAALRAGTEPPLPSPGTVRITSVRLSSPELTPAGELDEASSIVVELDLNGGSRGVIAFVSKRRRYEGSDLASARELAAVFSQALD